MAESASASAFAPSECRILIVEGDEAAVAPLRLKLSQAGFMVDTATQGEDICSLVDRQQPHLVVLDWDLPGAMALKLVRHIRQESRGPRLIAISSLAAEHHVVAGFVMGVDDYVVKPYSVTELVARVRAVLRLTAPAQSPQRLLEFHGLQIDASQSRVTVFDKTISLRRMEFILLEFLMRHPERAYSREALLRRVWGTDSRAGARAVDVTVQRIRRALSTYGCGNYVQTVRGLGYRLSADHR